LQDFVDGAVASAGDDRVAAARGGLGCLPAGAARGEGLQSFGFNAGFAQDGESFGDGCAAAARVLPGGRIVDQRDTAHGDSPGVSRRARLWRKFCSIFASASRGRGLLLSISEQYW